MKHHDGEKRINKVDGGKKKAKKQYHKKLREAGKRCADDDCEVDKNYKCIYCKVQYHCSGYGWCDVHGEHGP